MPLQGNVNWIPREVCILRGSLDWYCGTFWSRQSEINTYFQLKSFYHYRIIVSAAVCSSNTLKNGVVVKTSMLTNILMIDFYLRIWKAWIVKYALEKFFLGYSWRLVYNNSVWWVAYGRVKLKAQVAARSGKLSRECTVTVPKRQYVQQRYHLDIRTSRNLLWPWRGKSWRTQEAV